MIFCRLLIYFKTLFYKSISGKASECQTVLSGLNWVQNVCKDYPQITLAGRVTSFHASSDFCRLLITFASSLDPYQDQQNLDPNYWTLYSVPERFFLEKISFEGM